ncbi:MAG TPA: CHASE2 domain-containing protein [Cyclobacteriaceae bacterium]|jgi:CHASE2 domain-containing sensor protein|nr:CHASE2 domain-containing protein [Cyclobacteriaceae bacterium]HRE65670.1 CHASE2 domain-containing protein [Cyclobacteriaceae bacterium]HRF35488.1 CHASE2 domain-containing protein [Cyclobacteriaceae bacterium]
MKKLSKQAFRSIKKLSRQSLTITVFVFTLMWGVDKITDFKFFNAFDPISQALSDFELTDYAFSNLRETPSVDQRIVLVNLAPTRGLIAQQIMQLKALNPKVIGVDSFFDCEGGLYDTLNCPQLLDTLGNLMLSNAIQEAGNVVLVSKLVQTKALASKGDIDEYDSIEYSDKMFRDYARNAYANLPTDANYQDDVKLCRSLFPKMTVNGNEELAFSVRLAMMYDSVKTEKFLARNKYEEVINFRGNVELMDNRLSSISKEDISTTRYPIMFYAIDWDKFLEEQYLEDIFKGSIVMLGSMGSYFGDLSWEDKFFTPLNKKVAGRANPDMFGLVVHANVVAMILNEDYIGELKEWHKYAIAIVVCFFTIILFILIDRHLPLWFDTLSVLIQVVLLLTVSGSVVYFFTNYSAKLDLALTLAASALVGPAYDIFKGFQNQFNKWFTKKPVEVLNE